MSVVKLLPGWETILAIPATEVNGKPYAVGTTGLVAADALTSTILNQYQDIFNSSDPQSGAGGNISAAVLDDLNLGVTGADTVDTKTVVSKGNSEDPTFDNYDAELNLLRDADLAGNGVFNLARDLTRAADVPYLLIHRIKGGKDYTETFAAADEIDIYYVWTDNPVPGYGDGDWLTAGINFVSKGWVLPGYVLPS